MSSTTKKKHVCREVLDDYVLPSGSQEIVRVAAGRGNNLHEVLDANGKSYLVSMPTKFRKSVWIKRGDFVIVEPIEEGDKVQAEIVAILYRDQIRYIKRENLWPAGFEADDVSEKSPSPFPLTAQTTTTTAGDRGRNASPSVFESGVPGEMMPPSDDDDGDEDDEENDYDGDEFLVVNPNRPRAPVYESSSEEEEEEEEEEDEDDVEEKVSENSSVGGELGETVKLCHISTQAHCKG